jgi:hypothetical protein
MRFTTDNVVRGEIKIRCEQTAFGQAFNLQATGMRSFAQYTGSPASYQTKDRHNFPR